MQEAIREILEYLYEEYKMNPCGVFDIDGIAEKYERNSKQVASELKGIGLIKQDVIFNIPTGILCSITPLGIYQLDTSIIHKNTSNVIRKLGASGGFGNIIEYINIFPFHFQQAVDFANYLTTLRYIRIIKTKAADNLIICELTADGEREFSLGTFGI